MDSIFVLPLMWLSLVKVGHLNPNANVMTKHIMVEKLSLEIRRKKSAYEARGGKKISPN